MANSKTDNKRGMISFAFVILLGYIIGILIKRVHLGLMIGLALGLIGSLFLKKRR